MKWIQLLAFSFMLVMNYLANALPIQGKTTGELSAQYPNLFVPAGWAFSIWGIIYLLLGIWVAGALIYKGKEFSQPLAWLFIAGSLLNASWILAWHHEKTLLSL
ncbi:tryptophan-rich sensory protein, partial [Arthrospira platensis SPKY1]|nr:tryptophan-rich sensory protein [Arthrospira platensis SPKY1]